MCTCFEWEHSFSLHRFRMDSELAATMCFWGGGRRGHKGQKFGVGRSTRQRITALLGRLGSRVRLFSVFFLGKLPTQTTPRYLPTTTTHTRTKGRHLLDREYTHKHTQTQTHTQRGPTKYGAGSRSPWRRPIKCKKQLLLHGFCLGAAPSR